jgi:hypothetical protein
LQAWFELGPEFECRLTRRKMHRNELTSNVADSGYWTAMAVGLWRSRAPARHDVRPAEGRYKAKQ